MLFLIYLWFFFSFFFQWWHIQHSTKMRSSRDRDHLCCQIFIQIAIQWLWNAWFHYRNLTWNCCALCMYGFQQNCSSQGCLSDYQWNHSCTRIVSIHHYIIIEHSKGSTAKLLKIIMKIWQEKLIFGLFSHQWKKER